jgi:hypothetical protein
MTSPGSLLKFRRAEKHLLDAKTATNEFLRRKPYEITRDEESEPGKLLYWMTLFEDPPSEISLAAGDALHNMRSALDHIVYELSSKRETNPRDTSFPLHTKEGDWDKRNKDGTLQVGSGLYRVRLLPEEAQTIIHDLQPCPHPQPFMPDLFGPNRKRLRELHALDIADKHKNLNLAVFEVDIAGVGTDEESPIRFEYVFKGTLNPNARTLLLRLFYPTKVNVELLPGLDVVFSEGLTPNEPVGRKLDEIIRNIGLILNALSRFA